MKRYNKKSIFMILTIVVVFLVSAIRTGLLMARYPETTIDVADILAENGADLENIEVDGSTLRAATNAPGILIDLPDAVTVYEIGIEVDNVSRANCRSYIYLNPSYEEASTLLADGMNYWRFPGARTTGASTSLRYNPVTLRGVHFDLVSVTINPHAHFIATGARDFAIVAATLVLFEAILLALYYRYRGNEGWHHSRPGLAMAALCGVSQAIVTGDFLYLYVYERHGWSAWQTGFYFTYFIMESLFVLIAVLPNRVGRWEHREIPPLRIAILSIAGFALTETLYSDYMQHCKPIALLCNPLILSLVFVLCGLIPARIHIGNRRWHYHPCLYYGIPALLWMLAAGVNHYYYEFRAQALEFADITMAGTAGNVMGTYTLDLTPTVFLAYTGTAAIIWACLSESQTVGRPRTRRRIAGSIAYLVLAGLFVWNNTPTVNLWNTNTATKYNGYVYSFVSYMQRSLQRTVPDGYSAEDANAILAAYDTAADETDAAADTDAAGTSGFAEGQTQAVNLIVIMDEALADLPTTYGFETNVDGLPFIHSLSGSNVKKGNLLVSVFGGTTADSEYEFLTGNSLAFLDVDACPYTQYIDGSQQSLASMFEARGVYTTAFHPYLPNGYKRNKIYELLGFSQFVSSENDLAHNGRMRSYISDAADMENLIDIWSANADGADEVSPTGDGTLTGESVDASNGQFLFNVTMQNHGNYSTDVPAVDVTVMPTDERLQSAQLEEYLSLAYATDQAFEELVEYYETVDEPTIILLFGDHQPGMDESVYKRLCPAMYEDDAPLSEIQRKYTVPYVIWANYDLPDLGDGDGLEYTSTNFLRSYFLENAGVELTAFDAMGSTIRRQYPALNIKGFLDADGEWHTNADLADIDLMQDYEKVCYLNLFDSGKMVGEYFE